MVDLVSSCPTSEELSGEFEPTAQAIANWLRQAERDAGRRDDELLEVERAELARLRRENRLLHQEREILAKAAAWFARETARYRPGLPVHDCAPLRVAQQQSQWRVRPVRAAR
jgi:transposase